jgi:hypothetical protein
MGKGFEPGNSHIPLANRHGGLHLSKDAPFTFNLTMQVGKSGLLN